MKRKKEIPDQVLLFEIAENNDEDAFRLLFDRYSGRLFNLIYKITQHYEDSNDLLQEVFIRVYKNRMKCFKMRNFRGWVYTVTLNVARDYLRMNKRRRETVFDNSNGIRKDNDPLKKYEKAELKRMVLDSLNKISDKYKRVFVLRDIEGLSYEEISKTLRIREGTVKSRLNRARLRLARELKGKI